MMIKSKIAFAFMGEITDFFFAYVNLFVVSLLFLYCFLELELLRFHCLNFISYFFALCFEGGGAFIYSGSLLHFLICSSFINFLFLFE